MSRLLCSDIDCERAGVRQRDDRWYCLFHPDQTAPSMDMLTGKLRNPEKATRLKESKPRKTPKVTGYRAPGRVIVHGGPCLTDPACIRSGGHAGRHGHGKPERTPRPAATPKPTAPEDGMCLMPDCTRPWKHTGRHGHPAPPRVARAVVDEADAIRRYQNGEALFALAAELHVGANRLRDILKNAGVPIRSRGQVITRQPAPVDWDAVERLYADGQNTTQIARHFHTHSARISSHLRDRGLLRRSGSSSSRADVRIKLAPEEVHAVRLWCEHQEITVTDYLRSLIKADLATTPNKEQVA